MSAGAWGRWGPEDEVGALNLIGRAERMAALSLVRDGRVISLAQRLDDATPMPRHRIRLAHFMDRDAGDYAAGARRPGGFQFAEDTVLFPTHSGTHIDALCHVWYDDELYNGHPANSIRSTTGATRCGIETMPPIIGRGVLLDAVAGPDDVPPQPGDRFDARFLQEACERARVTLAPGDVVLMRTGWAQTAASAGIDYFSGEPGIDVSGGQWLAEQGVAVVGADNYAIEAIPFPDGKVFPVHQRLIRDYGMPLIEGLVLNELADTGRTTFAFVAAPLPLAGATASPLHPVALL